VDATLVDAQVRCSRDGVTGGGSLKDPDASWARRGRQARFGYRLYMGMDADSELMRRAHLTRANVNETQVADQLIAGDEGAVYGDATYGTHAPRARLRARSIRDRLMRRPSKHHPRLSPAARRRHARIEAVRRPVEHVSGTLNRTYGYQRVRYRGLARNVTAMWFMLPAYNLRPAEQAGVAGRRVGHAPARIGRLDRHFQVVTRHVDAEPHSIGHSDTLPVMLASRPALDLRARTNGPGNCSGSAPAEESGRPCSPTVSHDPGVYGLSRPRDCRGWSKTLGTFKPGHRQGVFRATNPELCKALRETVRCPK
jgi:IS5 family transposase